jgi:hypothetical protein
MHSHFARVTKDIQATPTAFHIDRTEIHANSASMISAVSDADYHRVPLISLHVLKRLDEHGLRSRAVEEVCEIRRDSNASAIASSIASF